MNIFIIPLDIEIIKKLLPTYFRQPFTLSNRIFRLSKFKYILMKN